MSQEVTKPRSPEPKRQTDEDKTMAILAHILALMTGFIAPLVIYFVSDEGFGKRNAANATNWQISFTIYMFIAGMLSIVLIGLLLIPVLLLLDLVFCILAAVKASNGETYQYPITIDLL